MNRWRRKNPEWGKPAKKAPPDHDSGSTDAELTGAADDIYETAAEHRKRVIAADLAAKARKKSAHRRG
jgi:hypothetical protein